MYEVKRNESAKMAGTNATIHEWEAEATIRMYDEAAAEMGCLLRL